MKKMLISTLQTILLIYLAILVLMYVMQRGMLYFPVPSPSNYSEQPITFNHNEQTLHGWVLNPGKAHAVLYYGGNAEQVEQNTSAFYQQLSQYTTYLVPYRGYGRNAGTPTEQDLFSDALHIYDQIKQKHQTVSAIGRSLGSGVATYVAANREIERLVLVTPYDSIANVAQSHYPFIPASLLLKDKYESFKRANKVTAKTQVFIAEHDMVVPPKHGHALIKHFINTQVEHKVIGQAEHNDISYYSEYKATLTRFMAR